LKDRMAPDAVPLIVFRLHEYIPSGIRVEPSGPMRPPLEKMVRVERAFCHKAPVCSAEYMAATIE
jgi:hypothetical protein